MNASVRRLGIIALGETRRTGGSFDRKTSVALLALGLVTSLVVGEVAERGLGLDAGIYRVAVDGDSPVADAALGSRLFQVYRVADPLAAFDAGQVELAVVGDRVYAEESDKGQSALAALEDAVRDQNYARMAAEPDAAAAFPVRVEVAYEPQPRRTLGAPAGPIEFPEPQAGAGTGGRSSGGASTGTEPLPEPTQGAGGFAFIPAERSVATPETLAPPFPFRSLVLAYLFLVPMNFVVQVYAGSAIAERIGRKGEALLASPARPWEIVVGKMLPYLALMVGIGAVVALGIGAGWLSLLAVASLAVAFLGMQFVAAMFARSFRELTFLTVFTSVLLTVFAFLPAVFSDVHPIAFISPITLVVMDLRDEAVTLGQVLYATLPLALFALSMFVLGTALYREEDLFHQKPVHGKALDALALRGRGRWGGFRTQLMLLPAVVVLELLLVTFLFAWPVSVGLVGVLVTIALVEETFKAAPSYARFGRASSPWRRALLYGALTGLGFFVAEKGFFVASLAGLADVPAGQAVFGAAGSGVVAGASVPLLLGLLFAPLALHVATAAISAWGASRGKAVFGACFAVAVAVHVVYNATVIRLTGNGVAP